MREHKLSYITHTTISNGLLLFSFWCFAHKPFSELVSVVPILIFSVERVACSSEFESQFHLVWESW